MQGNPTLQMSEPGECDFEGLQTGMTVTFMKTRVDILFFATAPGRNIAGCTSEHFAKITPSKEGGSCTGC
jgi:hypothetical protein